MKTQTHPLLIETKIQFKDGSTYRKKWQFFRATLPLEVDSQVQLLWKKDFNRQDKNNKIKTIK